MLGRQLDLLAIANQQVHQLIQQQVVRRFLANQPAKYQPNRCDLAQFGFPKFAKRNLFCHRAKVVQDLAQFLSRQHHLHQLVVIHVLA